MSNQNTPERVAGLIEQECDSIKALLLAKNRAYGNSALDPVRIFSKSDPIEQIRVRIDDKLSRLSRGSSAGEDVEQDLLGYLVLLRVARKLDKRVPEATELSDIVDSDGEVEGVFQPDPGYRILRNGEVIREGDEIWDFGPAKWIPCSIIGSEVYRATVRRKLPAAVEPGLGYRLLGDHEIVQKGDEFNGWAKGWRLADRTVGSSVSNALRSRIHIRAFRRAVVAKTTPGAGERIGALVE